MEPTFLKFDLIRENVCALANLNIQQPTLKSNRPTGARLFVAEQQRSAAERQFPRGALLLDFTDPCAIPVCIGSILTLDIGHSLPFPAVTAFASLKPVSASLRLLAAGY
jgi:hypothetical protein